MNMKDQLITGDCKKTKYIIVNHDPEDDDNLFLLFTVKCKVEIIHFKINGKDKSACVYTKELSLEEVSQIKEKYKPVVEEKHTPSGLTILRLHCDWE